MDGIFLGLISGTSMDGIDAVLIEMASERLSVLAGRTTAYAPGLRQELRGVAGHAREVSLDQLGQLDVKLGEAFAAAALDLISRRGLRPQDITAIGSHGQTVRHRPGLEPPFTMQLADAAVIAARTSVITVADFRRRDVALGGQGAPLVPPFHAALLGSPAEDRAVVNVGGIANLSLIRANGGLSGFDTGPGNALMDVWAQRHGRGDYDEQGRWAASGAVNASLFDILMADAYFGLAAPKSTGTEHFNGEWLDARLATLATGPAPVDVAATLCELSARTIADAILGCAAANLGNAATVFVCGGGAHNAELMRRLQAALPERHVHSTAKAGVSPDWVEGAAFAWLAQRTLAGLPGNAPAVTGASRESVLGAIHPV